MSHTRTGGFGIGFRRGWSDWQKDLPSAAAWAKANGFECLDVGGVEAVRQLTAAGLAVGSADLPDARGMISPDPARRGQALAANSDYVRQCKGLASNFFLVMCPEKPELPRRENFNFMVESFARFAPVLEECGSRIVIEGWPGPGALCCTPETVRAFFQAVPSKAMGLNYDPSHLIRMGIDPLRFLEEFAPRVGHMHGKDTEMLAERQYELGIEQPATFAEGIFCGGNHWRYCIPGHGQMRWTKAFELLAAAGYKGKISIELEDGHFNGTEAGEKEGLTLARRYLEGC
jgi:sugar phosphate isomerase/epimerase